MSQKEAGRLAVLEQRKTGQLSQEEAAYAIEVSVRQMRRLEHRYEEGPVGIGHRSRGKPGNRRSRPEALAAVASLCQQNQYADYGPTLLREKLLERGDKLCVERVRKEMIKLGHWEAHVVCPAKVHARRARKRRKGELLQADGSKHIWFGSEHSVLLVAIDDATSTVESLRFELTETTLGYWRLMEGCFRNAGKPKAIYTDRHVIFKVNHPNALDHETRLRQSMKALGIETICARTPQAKGRVERVNRTLQDRLVKFLRERSISTIEHANQLLEEYRQIHNKMFSVPPEDEELAYTPVDSWDEVKRAFSMSEKRTVAKDLSISFAGQVYVLDEHDKANRLRGRKVQVFHEDTRVLRIEWSGEPLKWHAYGSASPEAVPPQDDKDLTDTMDAQARAWINKKPPITHILRARRAASTRPSPSTGN